MDLQKVREIFFPEAHKAMTAAKENGNLFAYYTTAEVAHQIIENKEIWMRSTTTMNDYMEINYGLNLLRHAYEIDSAGKRLRDAIDKCHSGLADEVWGEVKAWAPSFWADTFITCLSAHNPEKDSLGKLSMWRAYGGKTGVALVVSGEPMSLETRELGAYSSPVSYFTQEQFCRSMEQVAINIETHSTELAKEKREAIHELLFIVFHFAVLCTKHPGFREESEWRIVTSSRMQQVNSPLKLETAIVRGVPQPVYKLPLKNEESRGIVGLSIPELLKRVIIGPCEFSHVTYRALWHALRNAGVAEPEKLIIQSDIPLRHS